MSVPTTYIAVATDTRLTGIVARQDNTLLDHRLVPFHDHEDGWLRTVVEIIDGISHARPWDELVVLVLADLPGVTVYGRNGIGYGVVLNALLTGAAHTGIVGGPLRLVQLAGYGSWLHAGYPPELVGSRERQGSRGRLHLARAAWDMAGAAMPEGPPTVAAERERLRELVTVEGPSRSGVGDDLDLYLTCQVCGFRVIRHLGMELVDWDQVRVENQAAYAAGRGSTVPSAHERSVRALEAATDVEIADVADRVTAAYTAEHVGAHLHAAGRDGSRLITPPGGEDR